MIQTSKYTDAQKKRLEFYRNYKFETPKQSNVLDQSKSFRGQEPDTQTDPELLKRNQEQVAKQVEGQKKIAIPDVLYKGLEELKNIYETPSKLINQGVEKLQDNPIAGAVDLGQGIVQGAFAMSGIPQTFSAISTGLKSVFGEEAGKHFDDIMNLPSTVVEQGTKAIDKVIDPKIQHEAVTMAVQGLLSTGRPEFQILSPLLTEKGQGELAQSIDEVNKLSATLLSFSALNKAMPKKTTPIEVRNVSKSEVVKENILPDAEKQTADLPSLEEAKTPIPEQNVQSLPESKNIEQKLPETQEAEVPLKTETKTETPIETPTIDKERLELPQKAIDTSTLQQLNMGVDLGIDKFITQDVKPALQKTGEVVLKGYQALKSVPNFIGGTFQPALKSIKKFGGEAYSSVIEGIHRPEKENIIFNNQKLETYDTNFAGLEKFFNTFTPEEINKFNLSRGTAKSPEAIRLQNEAKNSLSGRMLDKQLFSAIKEVSDYNYKLATDNGLTLDYFKDYFFGAYKDSKQVTKFLDYWQTTEKFTKEKSIPTIADATAFGLELKDPNPITNLRKETEAISRRVGMLDIQKFNETSNAPYMVRIEEAKPEQLKNWESLGDNAFKGFLYDPTYAKFVNSLISTNKVSQNGFLKVMKQTSSTLQQVKFLGSLFHLWNMAKHSIAGNTGGIANPKGFLDIVKGFKKYEESSPEYIEYTGLGGSHKYSIESEAQTQMTKALDRLSGGNALGGLVRLPAGLLQQKWVPLSPGMVKWMFQDYIPTLKFERWKQDNIKMAEQLGRPLTKAEKIANIRTIQQFYGEMNERLYGRSGTVTSALRLVFMAPGYGEGNFRTLASSMNLKDLTKKASQSRKNLKYVANSLTATLTLATIGTAIITGKHPDAPKTMDDVRDLFKIKTGQKDGNGDEIFVDLMTYDKDYWATYGELSTGHVSGAAKEFTRRVSGAVAPGFKSLNDMTTLFNGGMVYDYKGDPIFYSTDNLDQKVGKFLSYEGGQMLPISTSVYSQSAQKGSSTLQSIITSGVGLRPTTSEGVKRLKEVRNDLISMKDEKLKTQLGLNKLANENPQEAEKQRIEFNNKQTEKLNDIQKETGFEWKENLYLIKKLNPYLSKTAEESVRNLLQGKKKKSKINIY